MVEHVSYPILFGLVRPLRVDLLSAELILELDLSESIVGFLGLADSKCSGDVASAQDFCHCYLNIIS